MSDDTATEALPNWGGLNHLALVTNDMDTTVRFYHGVLGMPLVANLAAAFPGGSLRHYFFRAGEHTTLAFFEWPSHPVGTFVKPAGVPFADLADGTPFPAQFDHVSFTLPSEDALEALRTRLAEHGTDVTVVVDHKIMRSVYFTDNNGIALEASWWVVDPTEGEPAYGGSVLMADPDPVAAVRELAATGELAWMPATQLASDLVVDPA